MMHQSRLKLRFLTGQRFFERPRRSSELQLSMHKTYIASLVELRMNLVVNCVDFELNNQPDIFISPAKKAYKNVKNTNENVVIQVQGLIFCLEMIMSHISYGHHFMTLIFFFYFMITLRIWIKALLVGPHQFLNRRPLHCKTYFLNGLQLTCRKSQEASVVTPTILITVPKHLHMQTCGVWMAAWMEHVASSIGSITPENPNHKSLTKSTQISQPININSVSNNLMKEKRGGISQTHTRAWKANQISSASQFSLFSSSEYEPLLLPLSPKPVFKSSKAIVSRYQLCVCLNDTDETPLPAAALSTMVSAELQHALRNQTYFSPLGYLSKNSVVPHCCGIPQNLTHIFLQLLFKLNSISRIRFLNRVNNIANLINRQSSCLSIQP
ncbi:hypothetical protein VP01_3818g2 [Puccinia sorghi]|uniref:Uncharacterized protein n=1 Tax=Puccinia sorghi TaxID=27349 RepID=A0A0L6UV64_9BASI|nr:hypothetical protein VP01_3818g2 [Puccinia sorghi]